MSTHSAKVVRTINATHRSCLPLRPMANYLVTYDLVGTTESSEDYRRLIAHIKSYSNWAKVQLSTWIVQSTGSASDVHAGCWAHMDPNDRLFVIATKREAAWQNALCDDNWLQTNL